MLQPHSSEWFEHLLLTNTQQAMHTGAIIAAAGREDICSICGDEPAPPHRLADGEWTMRLCDDCVGIRRMMFGEVWLPV